MDIETTYEDGLYDLYRDYARKQDSQTIRAEGAKAGTLKVPMDIGGILQQYPIENPPNPELVRVVIGFLDVETMIPDYSKVIASGVRHDVARTFFNARWTGEEAVHSWILSEWLIAAGVWDARTSRKHLAECLAVEWNPIPHSPRHGELLYGPTSYVVLQEKRTAIGYEGLGTLAKEQDQLALWAICRRLAQEEARHYGFYLSVARLCQDCFPEFPEAFRAAHKDFAMPGKYILEGSLPDYDGWTRVAQKIGIIPDPIGMIRLGRQLRSSSQQATRETIRQIECWERTVRADRQTFDNLGLTLPDSITRLPRFKVEGNTVQLAGT